MIEQKKLADLYEKTNREIFVYIFRMVRSHETAEDILHDSFVNLINYSCTHEIDETGIRPFLYKTAHNLCINFIKRNKKFHWVQLPDDVPAGHISDLVDIEELNSAIAAITGQLDDLSRSIFTMKRHLHYSASQIAEKLGISERTVRRKLNAILNRFGDSLKKLGFLIFWYIICHFL